MAAYHKDDPYNTRGMYHGARVRVLNILLERFHKGVRVRMPVSGLKRPGRVRYLVRHPAPCMLRASSSEMSLVRVAILASKDRGREPSHCTLEVTEGATLGFVAEYSR